MFRIVVMEFLHLNFKLEDILSLSEEMHVCSIFRVDIRHKNRIYKKTFVS